MDYSIFPPIYNFLASPLLIAIVATLHVIVAHFAIGGGFIFYLDERKSIKEGDRVKLEWLKPLSFKFLYITLTFGAVSGVGIWFSISLLSPLATGYLITNFIWVWAMEWAFFILEVFAILLFVETWERVSSKLHLRINLIYFISAFLSLFFINAIITFQLTPSKVKGQLNLFKAFFNRTFFPSLFSRSLITLIIASLFFLFFLSFKGEGDFKRVTSKRYFKFAFYSFLILIPALVLYGYQIPKENLENFTRISYLSGLVYFSFLLLIFGIIFSFFLSILFPSLNKPLYAILPLLLVCASFGMMEWLREDLRLPYTVSGVIYGNDLRVKNYNNYQDEGILKKMPFIEKIKNDEDLKGEMLFRKLCGGCHTLDSVNNLKKIFSRIDSEYSFSLVRKSSFMKAPMPPFPGKDEEATLISNYIRRNIKIKKPYKDGESIFAVRCAPCHSFGGNYRDLKKSFKGVEKETIYEMIGSLDSLTESMPGWTGSEEERKNLSSYIYGEINEGGKK